MVSSGTYHAAKIFRVQKYLFISDSALHAPKIISADRQERRAAGRFSKIKELSLLRLIFPTEHFGILEQDKIEIYGARANNRKRGFGYSARQARGHNRPLRSGKFVAGFRTRCTPRDSGATWRPCPHTHDSSWEAWSVPTVDKITGLSPVVAIEQKTTNKNPRSTVGTITEINDFLRLLFAAPRVPTRPPRAN